MTAKAPILILLFFPLFVSAQAVQVRVESEDSTWEYRGNIRTSESVMAGAEASLAEALSNYEAPELPMTHFAAEPSAESHQIRWTSGTPRQGFRLYLQRSSDGLSWQEIGTITGEASQQPLQDWVFEDPQPLEGANYYRLRQVTADGTSVISDVLVLERCPGGFHTTSLFPHPVIFGTNIHLELESPKPVKIRLLGPSGEVIGIIFRETATVGTHDIEVDVTELDAGTYYCEIIVGGQRALREVVR